MVQSENHELEYDFGNTFGSDRTLLFSSLLKYVLKKSFLLLVTYELKPNFILQLSKLTLFV